MRESSTADAVARCGDTYVRSAVVRAAAKRRRTRQEAQQSGCFTHQRPVPIFQIFQKAHDAQILKSSAAPRNFGEALVFLGIGMLVVGIGYHIAFMVGLRNERERLKADGLIHAESNFPVSLTLLVALLLLAIGVLAIVSMVYQVGPFG